jgi:hypothetical protein
MLKKPGAVAACIAGILQLVALCVILMLGLGLMFDMRC